MNGTEYNPWISRISREIGIKSSLILFGCINDLYFNCSTGKYSSFIKIIESELQKKNYKNIIKWDRIDGVVGEDCSGLVVSEGNNMTEGDEGEEYALDIDETNKQKSKPKAKFKDPDEFFPYMFETLNNQNGTAFIIDYSDYIFGNANSLSEKEREYLAILSKALLYGQSYNLLSDNFKEVGNIVIFITQNNATIPPAFYLNNPMVGNINIPLPGRNEREKFLDDYKSRLRVDENFISKNSSFEDLVDLLDGYSLKEISQIIKLSQQIEEKMSYEKLINLYKYGEKVSPWEELSKDKLATIKDRLGQRVKGQDEAIDKVKDVTIRAYTGFAGLQHSAKQKKPKGSLFFVGPTGVGKTELAKSLAEFVFGDESSCIRFDMSEYNHEHSDQRLVGAPPGYVGYESGGQLTNSIKEKPFCVLLFDEIEKAHGKILDKFLQILEDGRLTDGKGETVSFSEAIIIFTSNIGAAEISSDLEPKEARTQFIEAVRKHFIEELGRPELLNRIGDNIVAFNFIDDPEIFTKIARIKFKSVEDFVKEKYKATIKFENEDDAFYAIAKKAGVQNGGRGLLNVMESCIINPLAEFIFQRDDMVLNRTIVVSLLEAKTPTFDFDLQ